MPLLFVTVLILLIDIIRKVKTGYEFQTEGKINHLLFMDDLKLYSKSEMARNSIIQTVKIFNEDIEIQFGIKNEPHW